MFQYAYARARAEREGKQLTTSSWIGEEIFDLPKHVPVLDTIELLPTAYHQDQDSLIYTRKQVREWFKFKTEIVYRSDIIVSGGVVAHRRVGDYASLGYVVVSKSSYLECMKEHGLNSCLWITEEVSAYSNMFKDIPFLGDFIRMTKADTFMRGNSSFSWWAATLSNAKIYSPVIDDLEGGREQDCKFVEGNHPKFANLPMCTDLHLEEGQ